MAPASRIAAEVFHGKAYQLRASARNVIACFGRSAFVTPGPHRMQARCGLGSGNGPRGAVHNAVLRRGLRRRVLSSMSRHGVIRSRLMDTRSSVFTLLDRRRGAFNNNLLDKLLLAILEFAERPRLHWGSNNTEQQS